MKFADLKLLIDCATVGSGGISVEFGFICAKRRLLRLGFIEENPHWSDNVRITGAGWRHVVAVLRTDARRAAKKRLT